MDDIRDICFVNHHPNTKHNRDHKLYIDSDLDHTYYSCDDLDNFDYKPRVITEDRSSPKCIHVNVAACKRCRYNHSSDHDSSPATLPKFLDGSSASP